MFTFFTIFRNEAYNHITRILEGLLNQVLNPATLSLPSRPGPPVTSEISTLTAESAQNHVSIATFTRHNNVGLLDQKSIISKICRAQYAIRR